ncbi:MAG: xanthine dehydrogenase family protein molybdopterin-binding subunit [Thaumarchaeota archaeon]|nr:xanthine dehydrogenase family protein molybdopterin-binding subunit [Nitrososphaerota archaeon]
MGRSFGSSAKRLEDPRLLSGNGSYLDDVSLPGMLHAEFVRSTYPHAMIKTVDFSKLEGEEGFVAAFTARDFPFLKPLPIPPELGAPIPEIWPLAKGKVRFCGEPIALIIATTRYIAEDLAALVEVDYDPLEPVLDPERSLEKNAPKLYDTWQSNLLKNLQIKGGNMEQSIAQADAMIREKIRIPARTSAPIENRGIIAEYTAISGRLNIWSEFQFPHVGRTLYSDILQIPEARIHVQVGDVGGAFGLKGHVFPDEVAVCAAARLLPGHPIKWIEKRSENISFSIHEREQIHDLQIAVKKDGTILGLKDTLNADVGAYGASPWGGLPFPQITGAFLPGPYRIKNYELNLVCCVTNKTPLGSVRGPGMLAANFVMERIVDITAHRLGLDPYQVRMKNLIRSNEFPFTSVTGLKYDSCSLTESLQKGIVEFGYEKLKREHITLREKGIFRGMGIASLIQVGGEGSKIMGPSGSATMGYEVAIVRVEPDGSVKVFTGLAPQGQSSVTTIGQAVADELGVALEKVIVRWGDTDAMPYGQGTGANRGAVLGTSAAILAARKVKEKAVKIAAHMIEARPEDVELRSDDGFAVKGSPKGFASVSLEQVAQIALRRPDKLPKGIEPGLEATHFFEPPEDKQSTWSNATCFCELELDLETGKVRIIRFHVVHDCGRMINPMIVEGQIHGGIVQGIGTALYEEISYSEEGQILGGNFLDYLLPTSVESPQISITHLETISEQNPAGTKGMGEGGTIVAPAAIANAVEDAILHLNAGSILDYPLKPERVLEEVKRKIKVRQDIFPKVYSSKI